MWRSRANWQELAVLCRSLGNMLDSGVPLLRALKVLSGQAQFRGLSTSLREIHDDVVRGVDLAAAFQAQQPLYPTLMIELLKVAEQTGALPEILLGLAEHYEHLVHLRRTFWGGIAWPLVQLVAAIFIIAGLILILGLIAESRGGGPPPFDPLGLGWYGPTGALWWLMSCAAVAGMAIVIWQWLLRGVKLGAAVMRGVLRVPVLGACVQSFALARFAWAYALTQQAGMSVAPSLELSLKATGNPAYAEEAKRVVGLVMSGEELSTALRETELFPVTFLELVQVGENSGTVPEALQRASPHLEDQARRALAALTTALAWLVWALVALMIIVMIFRIFSQYVDLLNRAGSGIL
ncbi:MAG: general secretion pathway protein GspF [Planctomycetaceae bacterium]|nr:MAG: general secretion pathway protein GspF [Planctomycetaceae bacterium]